MICIRADKCRSVLTDFIYINLVWLANSSQGANFNKEPSLPCSRCEEEVIVGPGYLIFLLSLNF